MRFARNVVRPDLTYDTNIFIISQERNKASFTRAKGLGELSTKAVEEALFGPHKNWEQLRPQSWPNFAELIENLMGKDVEVRRDFLFNKVDFQNITFL